MVPQTGKLPYNGQTVEVGFCQLYGQIVNDFEVMYGLAVIIPGGAEFVWNDQSPLKLRSR